MDGPTPLYVNLYMYAVNKAAYKVLGKGGLTLSRAAGEEMVGYLTRKGLLPENAAWDDFRRLFIEHFGLADEVTFTSDENSVSIEMRGLKITEFLELTQKEKFEPVACPLLSMLLYACEKACGCRLALKSIRVISPEHVRVECAKVK